MDGSVTFTATARLSVALVIADEGSSSVVQVYHLTAEDFPSFECAPQIQGSSLSFHDGATAGLPSTQWGVVQFADGFASGSGPQSFTLTKQRPGPADLVAYRMTLGANVIDRMIVRRSLDLAVGAPVGLLDFGATEALTPRTFTFTATDIGSDPVKIQQQVQLRNTRLQLPQIPFQGPTAPLYTLPAALAAESDTFYVKVLAGSRELNLVLGSLGDLTHPIGPSLATPALSVLMTDVPARFALRIARQPEYAEAAAAVFQQSLPGHSHHITVTMTRSYAPEGDWKLEIPDLSSIALFNGTLPFTTAASFSWTATAFSQPFARRGKTAILGDVWRHASHGGTVQP